jgi:hypothetical protein
MQTIINQFRKLALIGLLGLPLTLASAQVPSGPPSQMIIAWDYPSNFWTQVQQQMSQTLTNPANWPALTNVTFRIYSATNLLGTNTQWSFAFSTNNPASVTNGAKVQHFSAAPYIPTAANYYSVTVSNLTGESFFGGLAGTPPPSSAFQGSAVIQSSR